MYIVLTGSHPFYVSGESMDTFLAKLKNPLWTFPAHFSILAQSLFLQLVKTNPLERYAAKDALKHPWITRQVGPIPLSYVDSVAHEHAKEKLLHVRYLNYGIARPCGILYLHPYGSQDADGCPQRLRGEGKTLQGPIANFSVRLRRGLGEGRPAACRP